MGMPSASWELTPHERKKRGGLESKPQNPRSEPHVDRQGGRDRRRRDGAIYIYIYIYIYIIITIIIYIYIYIV